MLQNPGPSLNHNSDFTVKIEHISEISEILSNITPKLEWYIFASELIEPRDKANLEDEKIWETKIYKTLECWISREGQRAKFSYLFEIVGKYSKDAQDKILKKFDMNINGALIGTKAIKLKPKEFWGVPERNDDFTDRLKIFEILESNLNFDKIQNSCCKIVLIGMGGSGKSSIATEFLYQNKSKFSNIFWIRAEIRSKFLDQFGEIAQKLNFQIDKNNLEKTAKDLIQNWFEQPENSNWVIVYDNIENQKDISGFIPKIGGFVIITSRNSHWAKFDEIKIDGFELEETFKFVSKILSPSEVEISQVEKLWKEFDKLPLGIMHAAYYIKYYQISIIEYLEFFNNFSNECLQYDSEGLDKSVFLSIQLSLKKISQENPLALEWLQVCSYFPIPERIEKMYLWKFIKIKNQDDQQQNNQVSESLQVLEIQKLILKYGIVKLNKGRIYQSFSIHRLVQKSIRILNKKNISEILTICTKLFYKTGLIDGSQVYFLTDNSLYLLPFIMRGAIELADQNDPDKISNIQKLNNLINEYFKFFDHMDGFTLYDFSYELYDKYVEVISKILTDPKESHAFYFHLGKNPKNDFENKIKYFEKSIEIVEGHFGMGHMYAFKSVQEILFESIKNSDIFRIRKYAEISLQMYKLHESFFKHSEEFYDFFKKLNGLFKARMKLKYNKVIIYSEYNTNKNTKKLMMEIFLKFKSKNPKIYSKIPHKFAT